MNEKHPTIKFTADWSQTSMNFLDVTVSLLDGKITTDLYVKATGSHHYIHSSSCHPYHCKKGIPYSQALRLNRICSGFWKVATRKGYSEREVRKQIFRARGFSRDSLLDRENTTEKQNKITFILTHCPVFQNVKNILAELHLLLTPDVAPKAVFKNIILQIVILYILGRSPWWVPYPVELQVLFVPFYWCWAPLWVFLKYFIYLLCELLFFGELSLVAAS